MPKLRKRRRSPLILLLLLVVWSVVMGWGLAQARELPLSSPPSTGITTAASQTIASLEPLPSPLDVGRQYYLNSCGSCHVALPPMVLPTETWRQLLLEPQHYGVTLDLPRGPVLRVMWSYLSNASRAQREDETVPFRVAQSRFFRALHPRVKFATPPNATGCASCHIGAKEFDYQSLSPQWRNAP